MKGTVLIVEDEENLRFFASTGLKRAGWQVYEADSGQAALAISDNLSPCDIVLLDLHLGGMDGLTVLRHLKERWPETLFIIITAYATLDSAIEGLRQGVFDYLRKPLDVSQIVACVERASSSKRAQNVSLTGPTQPPPQPLTGPDHTPLHTIPLSEEGDTLTRREAEVLLLLAESATNRTIAERLDISLITVKSHVTNLLRKMGVSSRIEAVTRAREMGLIR